VDGVTGWPENLNFTVILSVQNMIPEPDRSGYLKMGTKAEINKTWLNNGNIHGCPKLSIWFIDINITCAEVRIARDNEIHAYKYRINILITLWVSDWS
jgi:hypothetical protein